MADIFLSFSEVLYSYDQLLKLVQLKFSFIKEYNHWLLLLLLANVTIAQDSTHINYPLSLQLNAETGMVVPHNDYLKSIDKGYKALSVKIMFQTTGSKYWQQLYNYPQFGFGFYRGWFDPECNIGKPYALYSVFSAPVHRSDKWSMNWELNFGVAYFHENIFNVAISSMFSGYFSSGADFRRNLGKHFKIGAFAGFTHFSNGAFQKPNLGVNVFSPKLFLIYTPQNESQNYRSTTLPELVKNNYIDVSIYYGMKNLIYMGTDLDSITKYTGVDFTVYGLSVVVNRQVSYLSRIGLGVTFGYNGSYNSPLVVENAKLVVKESRYSKKLELSVYPSYELLMNKFAVVMQPGIYIYRVDFETITPVFYQRIGLKYTITQQLFTGFNLRAYEFSNADFIEWNIGWRFGKN
ncbi:MAG: acyloxyacyl hydrolase [Bacteroidales bacterium]|nr:acyloxyacyl hydrolase [Bacteroidales bacterium]